MFPVGFPAGWSVFLLERDFTVWFLDGHGVSWSPMGYDLPTFVPRYFSLQTYRWLMLTGFPLETQHKETPL